MTVETSVTPVRWEQAVIERIVPRTPRVTSVFLRTRLAPHVAGQHVDVRLTAPDGYQAQRSYSIASAPGTGLMELAIEQLDDGEVSPFFHDVARPGDTIEVRGPIVMDEWISPGTHIAAVGADKGGDQELDPRILQRARIFVDDIRQCRTDGEINVPLAEGLITEDDVAGEIGQVVAGKIQGRTSDSEITVFDSTGIALQDSATVPLEYERARAAGVGIEKKMIST